MPLSPTTNMDLVLPNPHDVADSDVWGTILNTAFGLIDLHDHTTGKGVPVPSAALRINADVAWSFAGTSFAITALRAADFAPVATSTVTALASALFVNSDDANNLYFRNQGGTNVKITDGNTLNVSIVGGIGGDYSAVGALVSFSDSLNAYLFQQQGAPRPWAIMQSGDLDIFQAAASITNRVKIRSPAALLASYELVLPPSLAASTQFLVATAAGVITHSNVTTANVVAPDFRRTAGRVRSLPASAAVDVNAVHTAQTGASGGINRWQITTSALRMMWPIAVSDGDRITGYTVLVDKNTSNANTISARLFTTDGSGLETALGAGNSNSANAPNFIVLLESGLTIDVVDDNQYYLVFSPGGGAAPAADILYHATVTTTRP